MMVKNSRGSVGLSAKRIKDFKLNALLEVTNSINNNVSTSELLTTFESIVRDNLNIGKLVLFSFDGQGWRCLLQFGVDNSFADIDVASEFAGITDIRTIDIAAHPLERSFEIIIPVYHKSLPLAYVLVGDIDEDESGMSAAIKHLPFVQTLTNIIVVAIENKKLAKDNIRQATMRRELELAWEVQRQLFPEELPNDEQFDMNAVYLPHLQVGGDYYDFVRINENEVALCVADVSGKGVPAALLMSNFQANIRVLLQYMPDLTELVRELNTKVNLSAKGDRFITLFVAKYNLVTRVMHYINAGHNPPILIAPDGVTQLTIGCTGLGMVDELTKVKEGILNISPNSMLCCYTDGLVEQTNEAGEEFGMERLQHLAWQERILTPKAFNAMLLNQIEAHKEHLNYVDDIALFTCRLH
jgi:sigma-B regulation protein RsbU (phosphoserine phosphatase)